MTQTDKKLIFLLQSDPEQGMQECIRRYGGDVRTICHNILREQYAAYVEDAVIESFVTLWQQIKEHKHIHSTLQGYLYGIARRKALEMIRKNKPPDGTFSIDQLKGIENLLLDEHADIEQDFAKRHNEKLVHQVIQEMPEPDRSIFLLRYFYFYKVREIADTMSLKEDNVESKLRRGKQRLRKKLEKRGILYD